MSGAREGCTAWKDRIVDLAYGEIAGAEADEVRAHVEACEGCRAELEGIMRVRSIVSASRSLDVPAGIEARVMSAARDALAGRAPAAAPAAEAGRAEGAGLRGWLAGLLAPAILRPAIATAATVLLVAGVVWVVGERDRGVVDRYTDRGEISGTVPGIGAPPAPPMERPQAASPAGAAEAPAQEIAQAVEKAPSGAIVDEGKATLEKLAKKDVATKAGQPGGEKIVPADEKPLEDTKVFAGPVGGTIEQGGAGKSGGKGEPAGAIGTLGIGASSGSDKTIAKEEDEDDVMALISTAPATAGDQEAVPPAKAPAPAPAPAPESKPPAAAYKSAPSPAKPSPAAAQPPPATAPAESLDAAGGASQPTLAESKTATESTWFPPAEGGEATKKKKGKTAEAEKSVAAEEAQAPADPFDQAMAEKKDKDWKGAIAILKTIKDDPSATSAPQARVYHELAICTAAAGSKQKALVIYENLLARFPDYAGRYQAMWEAALLYIEVGDKAGAKALLAQLEKVPAWQKKAKKKIDKLD